MPHEGMYEEIRDLHTLSNMRSMLTWNVASARALGSMWLGDRTAPYQTHEMTTHWGCHSWGSRILTQITQVCAMCSKVIWNKVFCDSTNLGLVKEMGLGIPQDSSDGQKCTNCILWSVCMYYGMYKIKWKSSLSIDPGYSLLLHKQVPGKIALYL